MNPLFAPSVIQSFLDSFPAQTRRRGQRYFAEGAVIDKAGLSADNRFTAVVRGCEDYVVTLEYDAESRSWIAECTCPMEHECKHAYAAMLALRANSHRLSASNAT